MNPVPPSETSLDELAAGWLAGDARAETLLFTELHVRFSAIAKRRVQQDHLEDLVQDALQIVLRKGKEQQRREKVLLWSLTILRNVIGNHYQARQREQGRMVTGEEILQHIADPATSGAGEQEMGEELVEGLSRALRELAHRFPRCAALFDGILASVEDGGGQREISQRALAIVQRTNPDLTRGGFYTALHRCRARLRALLEAGTEGTNHV